MECNAYVRQIFCLIFRYISTGARNLMGRKTVQKTLGREQVFSAISNDSKICFARVAFCGKFLRILVILNKIFAKELCCWKRSSVSLSYFSSYFGWPSTLRTRPKICPTYCFAKKDWLYQRRPAWNILTWRCASTDDLNELWSSQEKTCVQLKETRVTTSSHFVANRAAQRYQLTAASTLSSFQL